MHNLQVTARGLKLTDSLTKYINKKVGKLDKLFDQNISIYCEIIQTKTKIGINDYIVLEISIHLPKAYIKVERSGENFYQVVDEVEPVLMRQAKKYKEKLMRKNKKVKLSELMFNIA